MKTGTVSLALLFLAAVFSFQAACTKKEKVYTLENVRQEINESHRDILRLRKKGELEKSAQLALETGRRINGTYPLNTMYREDVSKITSVMGFLARLCSDKAMHIRNESLKPADSKVYSQLSDDLYALVDEIRRKMPAMATTKKPEIKKVTPNTGDEETPADAKEDTDDGDE